jgi:hypothetical protein
MRDLRAGWTRLRAPLHHLQNALSWCINATARLVEFEWHRTLVLRAAHVLLLARCAPGLRSLCGSFSHEPLFSDVLQSLPCLTSLTVDSETSERFYRPMRAATVPTLTSLRITGDGQRSEEMTEVLLRTHTTLESLVIGSVGINGEFLDYVLSSGRLRRFEAFYSSTLKWAQIVEHLHDSGSPLETVVLHHAHDTGSVRFSCDGGLVSDGYFSDVWYHAFDLGLRKGARPRFLSLTLSLENSHDLPCALAEHAVELDALIVLLPEHVSDEDLDRCLAASVPVVELRAAGALTVFNDVQTLTLRRVACRELTVVNAHLRLSDEWLSAAWDPACPLRTLRVRGGTFSGPRPPGLDVIV